MKTTELKVHVYRKPDGQFVSATIEAGTPDDIGMVNTASITDTPQGLRVQTSFNAFCELRATYSEAYGAAMSMLMAEDAEDAEYAGPPSEGASE